MGEQTIDEEVSRILSEKEPALVASLSRYYRAFMAGEGVTWDQAMRRTKIPPGYWLYCLEALPVNVGVPETTEEAEEYLNNLLVYNKSKSL